MDAQVLKAQKWIRQTYGSVITASPYSHYLCEANGITGITTFYSLIMGVQHELGIATNKLAPTFGQGTRDAFAAKVPGGAISASTRNRHLRVIVEAALYCKGYSGGALDGSFGHTTQASLRTMKADMGFARSRAAVDVKQLASLLSMDSYRLLKGGSTKVRSIQRWLNSSNVASAHFSILPCDGLTSATTAAGLLIAVQRAIGISSTAANGTFGADTRARLASLAALKVGTKNGPHHLVKLFKAALVLAGQAGVDWGDGPFSSTTAKATKSFQSFTALPTTARGDYATWCSLLYPSGDVGRAAHVADCSQGLDDARASALVAAGYTTVGRYLTGGTKLLTTTEIQVMASHGLRFFCIHQNGNSQASVFTKAFGVQQAKDAYAAATALKIPRGAVIYFAVDADITAGSVAAVKNYFSGVVAQSKSLGGRYRIGIYGARHVCALMSAAGLTSSSFVADIAPGWVYNRGWPLPGDWAFDQFTGGQVGTGTAGQLAIDKSAASGRYTGVRASDLV